jgi:hypothetical protein
MIVYNFSVDVSYPVDLDRRQFSINGEYCTAASARDFGFGADV